MVDGADGGGAGNDTADYSSSASGVTVDLAAGSATGGQGNDTLVGVENVIGSGGSDNLVGDAGDNLLAGGAGDDTLDGGTGNDTIQLGSGNDTLMFAAGDGQDVVQSNGFDASSTDTVSFGSGIGSDDIWLWQSGDDLVLRLLGSDDSVTLQGWYASGAGADDRMDRFELASGDHMTESSVQTLVNAMANWSADNSTAPEDITTMPTDTNLENALAAAWQS